jgi:hypothetical protein
MDKLPDELLSNIFAYLHFCEKRECMLVCHLWLNVIRPMALSETVHITEGNAIRILNQFLDPQISNKAQIKDLVIHFAGLNEEVLDVYQKCFPKVRSLYIQDCYYNTRSESPSEQHTQRKNILMSWIAKFEVLELCGSFPLEKCLLAGGIYSALKKLVVMPKNRMGIDILANTPNLISLTLGNIIVSTSYLEKIHSNLLFLKSLELENISLEPPDALEAISELVTPSEIVTTLFITTRHDDVNKETGLILQCLRYIRRKYTNLVEFRFLIGSLEPVSNLNEQRIFSNEMLPLIKHIGSKARLVEIDCSSMLPHLLELMNSSGFQAKCLKLTSTYGNSKLPYSVFLNTHSFIRELTINVDSSRWSPFFPSLMPSIKTLTIKGNHNFLYHRFIPHSTICLQETLGACSNSLSTLRIEKCSVNAPSSICQSYSLTTLQIHTSYISPAVCNFIAQSLPSLRYLELGFQEVMNWEAIEPGSHNVYFPETLKQNVELGSINLYRLDLHLERQICLKIKTNMDNRARYFYTPKPCMSGINWKVADHRCIWSTLRQATNEEIMVHSHNRIYLELNSVKLLYINNMVAN